MMMPEHVQWSAALFRKLADHGVWGVPRSGLVFQRQGHALVLISRMPWNEDMPGTAADLIEVQELEFAAIKAHFESTGIEVRDEVTA